MAPAGSPAFHFDVDDYLLPYIPTPPFRLLPRPISRFFGYRDKAQREVGSILVCFWSFLGSFGGIALVAGIFRASHAIQLYAPPVIFASLGATAILIYATIQSPLSQPRNVLLGHTLCAVVGVCVAKLFEHVGEDHVNGHRWVIGALACAAGSVLMCLTNTIHPPGGATALMAVADPQISAMGWSYVPLILLAVVLMLLWALVLNNIQRQYPLFWWTPRDVGRRPAGSAAGADVLSLPTPSMKQTPAASVADAAYCCATTRELDLPIDPYRSIVITAQSVFIPPTFTLGIEQAGVLEVLRDKLRTVGPADGAATHVAA